MYVCARKRNRLFGEVGGMGCRVGCGEKVWSCLVVALISERVADEACVSGEVGEWLSLRGAWGEHVILLVCLNAFWCLLA